MLAYPFIKELTDKVSMYAKNMKIDVYEIKNNFSEREYNGDRTADGTGHFGTIARKTVREQLLISRTMLKASDEYFLDDMSYKQLGKKLKTTVTVTGNNGEEFIKTLIK